MSRELILHIGINKTGTTSIQHFLTNNRKPLLENGILFPVAGTNNHNHHYLSRLLGCGTPIRQNEFVEPQPFRKFVSYLKYGRLGRIFKPFLGADSEDVITQKQCAQGKQQVRDALLKEMHSSKPDKVLISSELLLLSGHPEEIVGFFQPMGFSKMTVVIYLRRHDAWRESSYAQSLKMTWNPQWEPGVEGWLSFQRKAHAGHANYQQLVERWAAAVGEGNVVVRPFEKQQFSGNLYEDFLTHAGMPEVISKLFFSDVYVNESVSCRARIMLEFFQGKRLPKRQYRALAKYMMSWEQDAKKRSSMTTRLMLEEMEAHREEYEFIARKYLHREDAVLFRDPPPSADNALMCSSDTFAQDLDELKARFDFLQSVPDTEKHQA